MVVGVCHKVNGRQDTEAGVLVDEIEASGVVWKLYSFGQSSSQKLGRSTCFACPPVYLRFRCFLQHERGMDRC